MQGGAHGLLHIDFLNSPPDARIYIYMCIYVCINTYIYIYLCIYLFKHICYSLWGCHVKQVVICWFAIKHADIHGPGTRMQALELKAVRT